MEREGERKEEREKERLERKREELFARKRLGKSELNIDPERGSKVLYNHNYTNCNNCNNNNHYNYRLRC